MGLRLGWFRDDLCEGEEKGTGYFSPSFRGPSSSPQHRREIVREG